jgi:lipoate-protein ligase A
MQWRLLTEDRVSDSYGLAVDEVLARRAGTGASPATLRLYTYRSYAALVGRYQSVSHEVQLGYCQEHDIAVNRRPTGGGAILMGDHQLGIALTLQGRDNNVYGHARELMSRFAEGIVLGLRSLGITGSFRGKNDLAVNGRKIAGLGIYRDASGGLLFHASLLLDMDVPLMLNVLTTPFEKISDKEISTVEGRIETVRRLTGRSIEMDDLRMRIACAYEKAFHCTCIPGALVGSELKEIDLLEEEKYLSPAWIVQETDVPDATGSARVKAPGGLLDVSVSLVGDMIKAAYIRGDFFTSDAAVADIEASLRWRRSGKDDIRKILGPVFLKHRRDLTGIRLDDLDAALTQAISRARVLGGRGSPPPYGCFVNPGAMHA